MKVYVGQLYIEVGVTFPFSHQMQVWCHEKLTSLLSPTPEFTKKYGSDFSLMVRISAKRGLKESEIRGPGVYRKTKDVEYSLFLPYDTILECPDSRRAAVERLLDGIIVILKAVKLDPSPLVANKASLCDKLCNDPEMLQGPWPTRAN